MPRKGPSLAKKGRLGAKTHATRVPEILQGEAFRVIMEELTILVHIRPVFFRSESPDFFSFSTLLRWPAITFLTRT